MKLPRNLVPSLVFFALVATIVFLLGRDSETTTVVDTVVETVVPEDYRELVRTLAIENHGLRARLSGIRELAPDTILVVDTLVSAPDTVIRTVEIRDGVVRYAPLFRADSSTFYVPEIRTVSFGDCDDGLSIEGGRVVCDPAVFGNLYFSVAAGVERPYLEPVPPVAPYARIGLEWTPSYRSPWSVFLGAELERALLLVERRFAIFEE